MAKVTSRYNIPDAVERKIIEQHYHDIEARKQMEKKLTHLDDKAKDTVIQMESSRREIYKIRTMNKALQKKIDDEETEVKSLHTKLGSMKVKLGMANATFYTGNDEKEKLRTNLNEIQVEVARLEERLTAANTDLDRLRDPANPESNMSIRKQVTNDKKEIKRLKAEMVQETKLLDIDQETVTTKDAKIKVLEKEQLKMKGLLKECETDRQEAQNEEDFQRVRKEELMKEFQKLKIDRKSYDSRLKELKIKLGISVANQNVTTKFDVQIRKDNKSLTKQVTQLEKKLKEQTGQLDVLKNQHKMSKTAISINETIRRNQMKRGSVSNVSMAQSGAGPIKFASSASKDKSKSIASTSNKGSMRSIPEKLRVSEAKQNGGNSKQTSPNKNQPAGSQTNRSNSNQPKQKDGSTQRSVGSRSTVSTDKGSSNQLVPPPKPKLQKTPPR